jgi:hypothetical protein
MIHGFRSTPDSKCMSERAGEPGFGPFDGGGNVLSQGKSSRDCSGERTAGAVKATGDDLRSRELRDLAIL